MVNKDEYKRKEYYSDTGSLSNTDRESSRTIQPY